MFPNNLEALEEDSLSQRQMAARALYKVLNFNIPKLVKDDVIKPGKTLTFFVTENPIEPGDLKKSTSFITDNPALKFIYRQVKTPWLSEEQRQSLRAQRAVLP